MPPIIYSVLGVIKYYNLFSYTRNKVLFNYFDLGFLCLGKQTAFPCSVSTRLLGRLKTDKFCPKLFSSKPNSETPLCMLLKSFSVEDQEWIWPSPSSEPLPCVIVSSILEENLSAHLCVSKSLLISFIYPFLSEVLEVKSEIKVYQN